MTLLLALLAACGTPTCPKGQSYSPVFAQCIGEEEPPSPPPAPTTTGGTAATGATGDTGP